MFFFFFFYWVVTRELQPPAQSWVTRLGQILISVTYKQRSECLEVLAIPGKMPPHLLR